MLCMYKISHTERKSVNNMNTTTDSTITETSCCLGFYTSHTSPSLEYVFVHTYIYLYIFNEKYSCYDTHSHNYTIEYNYVFLRPKDTLAHKHNTLRELAEQTLFYFLYIYNTYLHTHLLF